MFNRSRFAAALISPLIGFIVLGIGVGLIASRSGIDSSFRVDRMLFNTSRMLIGLPIAYGLESIGINVVLPWLRRTSRVGLEWIAGSAALLGAAALVPVGFALGVVDSFSTLAVAVALGACVGGASGIAYWALAPAAERSLASA